jgi:hypothetical protein
VNERVTFNFIRYVLIGLSVLIFNLIAIVQSANAVPITKIVIPVLGTQYNIDTHQFLISGISYGTTIFNESGENTLAGMFALDTGSLESTISSDGTMITYTANSGGMGRMSLEDNSIYPRPSLLYGDLQYLRLEIIDSIAGTFGGTGIFSVEGGDLASDFGDNGGLATIGLAFQVPINFNNSFGSAMATTTLTPIASIPDVTTLVLLGSAMLIGSLFGRKKAF